MYSLIIMLLYISCAYTIDTNNQEEILDYLKSDDFFGFETMGNIYVIQFDTSTNEIIDFSQAKMISFSGNNLSLSYGDTSIQISTNRETNTDFHAIGLIAIEKGDDLYISFTDVFNNFQLTDVGNCWAGGPGSLSCSTVQGSASITVVCSTGYFSCCHRSITGLCVSGI